MKEQVKDLLQSEQELQDMIMSCILYLNSNGIHIERVKEMINIKVKTAFELYESEDVLNKFYEEFKND
jgi:hypothetical protein